MSLNLKNPEVDRLVNEVVALTGETKTGAIRAALAERLARLAVRTPGHDRGQRLQRFLSTEAWPSVPAGEVGRRLTRSEEDAILGTAGPSGDDPR